MMQKIEEVLQYFRNRKDLALWLRPHPLYEQTLEVMRPQFLRKYRELLASYEEEGWGILDSGYDLDLAIASCDCYYGDYSSVAQLFWETGKPVLLSGFPGKRKGNVRYHAGRELFWGR